MTWNGWPLFWLIVMLTALGAYFSLAVVIAIGGYFDVRKMFRRLRELHAKGELTPGPAADARTAPADSNIPRPDDSSNAPHQ